MRIGFLTTSFPRFEGDHAGAFILQMARALASLGHEIEVLAPCPTDRSVAVEPNRELGDAVSVTWISGGRPSFLRHTFFGAGAPENLNGDPRAWLGVAPFVHDLHKAVRAHIGRWDAMISHWCIPSGLIGAALGRDLPHVIVCHSTDVHLLARMPWSGQLAKTMVRGSDALVFVSRPIRERFLALVPKAERSLANGRLHVCPMGVDESPTRPSRRVARARWQAKTFTVLGMGRLVPIKGFNRLVEAAGGEDFDVIIAGDGPERTALASMAQRLSTPVRFTGFVAGEDKEALLRAADVLVVPSMKLGKGRTEGLPHVILEGMERGLPVVASDSGGIGDVVKDGINGVLLPVDAPADAFRQALIRLRGDSALRRHLSRGARRTASEYRWSAIAPRFEELLLTPDRRR